MAKRWALILGASSGFGEAASRKLAEAGYPIFGVHLDRRAGMKAVEDMVAECADEARSLLDTAGLPASLEQDLRRIVAGATERIR